MPTPLSLQNWKSKSSKFAKPRGGDLVDIDSKVTAYRNTKTKNNLKALAKAILDWQESKADWITSIRRNDVAKLIWIVKKEAETKVPEAWRDIFSYVHCEPLMQNFTSSLSWFLNNHVVVVSGSGDGLTSFKLKHENKDGTFGIDEILVFYPRGKPYYSFAASNRGPAVNVDCVNMHRDITPRTSRATVEGRFHPITAAPLLTTGQLTGCTFLMRVNHGQLECTHIEPFKANWANGHDLQDFLDGLGMVGVTSYGRNDYGDQASVAIIGRKHSSGRWHIYSQRYNNSTKTLINVTEIYHT